MSSIQLVMQSLIKPHSFVNLSFRLVRNLSLFSEGFPTRFTCGNDNCKVLLMTSTVI